VETLELDAYVLDTLMADLVGHDRQPSAFLVYLHLWRRTAAGAVEATLTLRSIAEGTGLSKRAVQDALARLARRRLVTARRETITATLTYTLHRPWARRAAPAERAAPE
jgi:transcription initiation factor IIE alpha subunit